VSAELSRMLFEARESIEMWADVIESKGGNPATHERGLIARVDEYRARQGWSPNGFGGEEA
jgi:hypothetical protein